MPVPNILESYLWIGCRTARHPPRESTIVATMATDRSSIVRAAEAETRIGDEHLAQSLKWIVLFACGGLFSLLTFAGQTCDPTYSIRALTISYLAFASALFFGWAAFYAEGVRRTARGSHLASAHNREQYREAANKLPVLFSAPEHYSAEANSERNELIEKCNLSHGRAERAWQVSEKWKLVARACTFAAIFGLIIGTISPLTLAAFDNKLVAEICATKK